MSFDVISVIGLGYIGLPTAAMFASRKKKVIGVDINQNAVDTINRGAIHIVEPDLDMMVHAAVSEGYLRATTKAEPADAFLIAVPTPFLPATDDQLPTPDLSYIQSAAESIAPVLKKGDLIVLESTSPVGATEQLSEWLADLRRDLVFPHVDQNCDIHIAHCPERVLPGQVVRELVENDRVIGGITKRCSEKSIDLYKIFVKGECIVTNARTAEMAKLTENSCRDVQIAFANELSVICDELSIDVWELINLANRHPRVNILQPGPGVGGHCIAVDPWFIVSKTPDSARLIHQARIVNDSKPNWVIEKIKSAAFDLLKERPECKNQSIDINCYGLTFKPNIDDVRESPAIEIVKRLASCGFDKIRVIDPMIESLPRELEGFKNVEWVEYLLAPQKEDLNVMLVKHDCFSELDHERMISFCGY
ncbi:UDP-N-acetyl-D-mannosamine dehydrogenase [Vibrio kasasachensis]|uniref:UDP-N-acetyl-D-mannosamine dehydrogenase n=1 Tax=Vibrio kasasachensis TaxID=2910248 RepID=UPI003D09D481